MNLEKQITEGFLAWIKLEVKIEQLYRKDWLLCLGVTFSVVSKIGQNIL